MLGGSAIFYEEQIWDFKEEREGMREGKSARGREKHPPGWLGRSRERGAAAPPGGRSSAAEGRAALRVGQAKLGPLGAATSGEGTQLIHTRRT